MLGDISIAKNVYIACGYTDMRKSIDGLAALVKEKFDMDPFEAALYMFCGRRAETDHLAAVQMADGRP